MHLREEALNPPEGFFVQRPLRWNWSVPGEGIREHIRNPLNVDCSQIELPLANPKKNPKGPLPQRWRASGSLVVDAGHCGGVVAVDQHRNFFFRLDLQKSVVDSNKFSDIDM